MTQHLATLFALLKKGTLWKWGELENGSFELAKESLINATIRAYTIPGKGFRLYTDACDEGLAGILQQIQPIKIRDLKETKTYLRQAEEGVQIQATGSKIGPAHIQGV